MNGQQAPERMFNINCNCRRQNKTKMRYTTHLPEWLKFNSQKINNTKYWQRHRTTGLSQITGHSVTQHTTDNTWQWTIQLPGNPMIPLLVLRLSQSVTC